MGRPSDNELATGDTARSWDPEVPGVTEVLHATFTEHAYPKHCHDTWTILLIDAGAVSYSLSGRRRAATPQSVTVLPPFVAHDGASAVVGAGFRKRVCYIETALLDEALIGAAVDRSAIDDPAFRSAVSQFHHALGPSRDDLRHDSLLSLIVDRIAVAFGAGSRRAVGVRDRRSTAAEALRATLDERWDQRLSIEELATDLGWNSTHLIRSFSDTFGLPPHRYLISRRIDEARRRLLDGQPASRVAVEVGFHDQAHLSRHFKTHVGTSPARFARR